MSFSVAPTPRPGGGERHRSPLPVFVVGYMHSGTTLLQHVLGRHSAVFAGRGETKFFDYLPLIRSSYPSLQDERQWRRFVRFLFCLIEEGYGVASRKTGGTEPASAAVSELAGGHPAAQRPRHHHEIFRLVFDAIAVRSQKTCWLEKTPTHVFHMNTIAAAVPGARFVEIVRDPRDILASKKTRHLSVWGSRRYPPPQRPRKHLEKAYDPCWDTLSWKSAVRCGLMFRRRHPLKICSLRYEDLVSDPEVTVKRICSFLSLPYESQMLEVPAGLPADVDLLRSRKAGRIAADSVGRWRRVLRPEEVFLCQALAGHEMRCWGYPRLRLARTAGAKVPGLLIRSVGDLFVRLSRKYRLGGRRFLGNFLVRYGGRLAKLTVAATSTRERPLP